MRIIPPPAFRGLFSPLYPQPTTHTILSHKSYSFSSPLLISLRFRSSLAALNAIVEPNIEIPRKLCSANWPESSVPSNILERKTKIGVNLDTLGTRGVKDLGGIERLKRYSQLLRNCALNLSLNEGKAIHGQVIKKGIDPDMHLWVSLINFYAKCHSLEFARQVFDEMPGRDVVSWTALIAGFVAEGYGSDGVYLFSEMRKEGIRPNEFTLATSLKAGSMCLDLEFGKQVHVEVIKSGTFEDVYVGSALVDLYAKCSEIEYARKVFFYMPRQNDVSWNTLLNGYAQMGNGEEVWGLFCKMKESQMKLSKFTLSTVLKGLTNSDDLGAGRVIHSIVIKIGFEQDEFVSSTLVDMYSKCGLADDALKVFTRIQNPDIVAWTSMISCLDQQGWKQEAANLFLLMRDIGLRPNQYTLSSLVSTAADLNPHYSESIHCCVFKYGFQFDTSVNNALITMYMKIGSVENGCRVFDSMSNRDLVSWNALFTGFYGNETCDQGLRIFIQMLLEGFRPNMQTCISILRSCSSFRNLSFGKQIHAHIIKGKLNDIFIGTALIDMYAKCRCLEDAEVVFARLKERDVFTWTAIISGYVQTDQGEKSIRCFSQMRKEGVKPNEFTLASCLRGCSGIANLEHGRQLHSLAIKSGQCDDIFVASAIVDMYGKCGCIDNAETSFKGLNFRDTVAWNSMIFGYSQHGQGEKALEAFQIMLVEGAVPDGVTFLGILSACSHMGLVEEGKKYFNSMSEVYGVIPLIEHYACIIDTLGRAGKFDEVESLIENMEIKPDALIWETVLGACQIHGNVEFGERAAEKLFELEPEIDSNYIMLSNIFAANGRWSNVSRIRALMSSRGVKKKPGCSWVDVGAQIHVFLSQDGSHPKILEIYEKLEELGQKRASSGYIPNAVDTLHYVNGREKSQNLFYHSERLALAFALISNTPNKTIRIFKNLRICGDCHDFMKQISGILNRQIVVRDIKRFHHFQQGTCSCQDYW